MIRKSRTAALRGVRLPVALAGLLLVGLLAQNAHGQSVAELEAQKKTTLARIQQANRLIEESSKHQKVSTEKLYLIESQIATRNTLIDNISRQIRLFEKEIAKRAEGVDSLKREVATLKKEYAEFLRKSQFGRSKHQLLMHILASSSLSQMYRRVRFYKEYLGYQAEQYHRIAEQEAQLWLEQDSLGQDRDRLMELRGEEESSRRSLQEDKMRYDQEVERLKEQQKTLKEQIAADEKRMQAINRAIKKLVAEEAEKNRSAKRDARYLKLSSSFAENRGKLPWPVVNGIISRGYGQEDNKHFKGIQTRSEGIDIVTGKGSTVMAVFPGEVSKIAHIPGGNNVVIIRHGEFMTLYSNLANVTVRVGDKVNSMQGIGTVFSDGERNQSTLHFEIWRGFTSQNPRHWLLP